MNSGRTWLAIAGPILSLAWPIMLSRFGVGLLVIVDSVMVGHAGVDELAYLAAGSQPTQSLGAVGLGLMAGLPAMVVGARLGSSSSQGGGRPGTGDWLASALAISFLFGAALALPLTHGQSLLALAQQPPELIRGGAPVMYALAWSMPALLMFQAASLYLEALGKPRIPLYIVASANLLKILLNLALIDGVPGVVEPLGAVGASIGTSIVRWLMLGAILLAALGPGIGRSAIGFRGFWRRIGRLLAVGCPVALATLFEVGGFLTFAGFAGALGAAAMAGYQIARSLYQTPHIPPVALGLSTSIHLAQAVHQHDIARGRATVRVGSHLNLASVLAIAAAVALFPVSLGGLFTDDQPFLEALGTAITITAALIVFDSLQGFLNGTLRGLADGLVPSLAQLASFWGVGVPLAYWFAFRLGWGLEGVLAGLTAGLAAASLLLWLRLETHPRMRRRRSLGAAGTV
jgi:MATE family multidrug resistance protein